MLPLVRWTMLCALSSSSVQAGQLDLQELVDSKREQHGLPALAAAAISSEGLIGAAVSGTLRSDAEQPVSLGSRFHIGSCTNCNTYISSG